MVRSALSVTEMVLIVYGHVMGSHLVFAIAGSSLQLLVVKSPYQRQHESCQVAHA